MASRSDSDEGFFGGIVFLAIVIVALWTLIINPVIYLATGRDITCTVEDKDRGNNDDGYRIYTKECGVLSNEDSLLQWKWNSADVQAQLEDGDRKSTRLNSRHTDIS